MTAHETIETSAPCVDDRVDQPKQAVVFLRAVDSGCLSQS